MAESGNLDVTFDLNGHERQESFESKSGKMFLVDTSDESTALSVDIKHMPCTHPDGSLSTCSHAAYSILVNPNLNDFVDIIELDEARIDNRVYWGGVEQF